MNRRRGRSAHIDTNPAGDEAPALNAGDSALPDAGTCMMLVWGHAAKHQLRAVKRGRAASDVAIIQSTGPPAKKPKAGKSGRKVRFFTAGTCIRSHHLEQPVPTNSTNNNIPGVVDEVRYHPFLFRSDALMNAGRAANGRVEHGSVRDSPRPQTETKEPSQEASRDTVARGMCSLPASRWY
jgi:hypothetical protein